MPLRQVTRKIRPRHVSEEGIDFYVFPDGRVYGDAGTGWKFVVKDPRAEWTPTPADEIESQPYLDDARLWVPKSSTYKHTSSKT